MPNQAICCFLRNLIDRDVTGYTLSGDFTDPQLAVDRDLTTFAGTNGLDTDGVAADFIIDLQWARTFDTLFIRSNFKAFTIQKSDDGSSYSDFTPAVAYTVNAAGFIQIPVTSITTRYIKIHATSTIVANQEKKLTEFIVTQAITNLEITSMTSSTVHQRVVTQNIKGGSIQVLKFPTDGKFQADITIEKMTGAIYTAYEAIKTQSRIDSFLALVYYSDSVTPLNSSALYLVNDILDFQHDPPDSGTFASGINGAISLREA